MIMNYLVLFALMFSYTSAEFDQVVHIIKQNLTNQRFDFDFTDPDVVSVKGYVTDLVFDGLDEYDVLKNEFSVNGANFGILNLTLRFPHINLYGWYNVNGDVIFPIGNEPIHIYGNGNMKMKLSNAVGWIRLTVKTKAGVKRVNEFDINFGAEDLNVKLHSFMDDGQLEDVFNELLDVLGLVVFDYYRDMFKDDLIKKLTVIINEFLANI